MSDNLLEHPYRLVNLIFAGIILLVFLYAAAFTPEGGKYPIPSNTKILTGKDSNSTGMSRAFSAIVRMRFETAKQYNVYSIRIFSFFLIQLGLRLFFLFSYFSLLQFGIKKAVFVDSLISLVLFVLFFEPFWRNLFLI